MANKQRINGRLKAEGQIIVLECDGNGRAKVLEKVKGFRQPAFWFVRCKGCAKCKRHLTQRPPDVWQARRMKIKMMLPQAGNANRWAASPRRKVMAKNGDFVTATVDLPEEHPTRQGILDGDLLHGESGATYKVVKVHAVVEKLHGSTLG